MSEDNRRRGDDEEELNLFTENEQPPPDGSRRAGPRHQPGKEPAQAAEPDAVPGDEPAGEEAESGAGQRKGGGLRARRQRAERAERAGEAVPSSDGYGEGQVIRNRRKRNQAAAQAEGDGGKKPRGSALPAIRKQDANLPAIRAERVEAIRRDLVRRRRMKGLGVLMRLVLLVVGPTMFVAWFLWTKASDLYETEAHFVVQASEFGGMVSQSGGGLFGALNGSMTDGVTVQNFILSRPVLQRLQDDHGLIDHFKNPELDWYHRLKADSSFEDAFQHYKRFVEVSFDPTEGVLHLTVVAADPAYAQTIALAIIGYAEAKVDSLSDPIRENALRDAETNRDEAEVALLEAQQAAAKIRRQLETFSVETEVTSEMQVITSMEIALEELRGRLANLRRRGATDDDPRVQRLEAEVATMQDAIAARREGVAGSSQNSTGRSLADINAELERANFDVTIAMTRFTAATEALELAKNEAARQHRYLSVVVEPIMPDASNFPPKLELTALAFLCFLGIYIMLSLTISLIREQASI